MKSPNTDEIILEGFGTANGVRVAHFRKGELTAAAQAETDEELERRKQQMPAFFEVLEKNALARKVTETAPAAAPKKPQKKRKKGCCGGKKTLGLVSLVTAKLSGPTTADVASARIDLCFTCPELDQDESELYREIDGNPYCGQPRLKNIYRDEAVHGCGCNLHEKVRYRASACPRGRWDAS